MRDLVRIVQVGGRAAPDQLVGLEVDDDGNSILTGRLLRVPVLARRPHAQQYGVHRANLHATELNRRTDFQAVDVAAEVQHEQILMREETAGAEGYDGGDGQRDRAQHEGSNQSRADSFSHNRYAVRR